ncbi:MAG: CHAP domain-containing protein [Gaiellaceae bacterium]
MFVSMTAVCAAAVAVVIFPTPLRASGKMPGRYPREGNRVECISTGYKCAGAGYRYETARRSGWPWARYGGAQASYNSAGPHNCTLYAAYRLKKNGVRKFPGWSDNGGSWYRHVSGWRVNKRPAIGAIAEWSTHVAYVESVSASGITISDDNYAYNRTTRQTIAWGSAHWPRHFIHLADKGPKWPRAFRNIIFSSKDWDGSVVRWLMDSSGKRHLIPSRSVYSCLRKRGVRNYGLQPDRIVELLPEPVSRVASCRSRRRHEVGRSLQIGQKRI